MTQTVRLSYKAYTMRESVVIVNTVTEHCVGYMLQRRELTTMTPRLSYRDAAVCLSHAGRHHTLLQ